MSKLGVTNYNCLIKSYFVINLFTAVCAKGDGVLFMPLVIHNVSAQLFSRDTEYVV